MRIIAHLDMDAFYASAELVRDPRLKGRPVAVGGRRGIQPLPGQDFPLLGQYQGRGVLTTANYEARKLGLHSAMPTMRAAKLAPQAILLPADFEWYSTLSRRFKEAVLQLTPVMENRGVDEIYLDLTEQTQGDFEKARQLAVQLKQAVKDATGGMTCSIGLSENKLTSKICSDLQKPDGLTLVRPHEFETVVWPLPVGKVNGIGPKAQAKLIELNIRTVGELALAPLPQLQAHFGNSYGLWLYESARGIDRRELSLGGDPKSISRETTFENDLHIRRDREALTAILTRLTDKLASDLERKKLKARTIGLKVRFPDFTRVTRDHTPGHWVGSPADILQAARECLKKVPFDTSASNHPRSRIRLLGVKASHLSHMELADQPDQLPLWEEDAR
ncbi:DNA polymerase IV [Limnobacter sp.]|uniref:DNA polymerase IV n=1 Tax=Limnobacter sp. TaxID=2003368 RepID=UPI0025861D0F|nr:DNA polymerase IV [Limnobacter sp.]